MRIKIEGEITADRLAEALQTATKKFPPNVQPTFYGANLYLTPYSADGLSLELVDNDYQPVMITIAAPAGALVRPALTEQGVERRRQANERSAARRAEEEAEIERQEAVAREQHEQYEARRATATRAWVTANALTLQLLEAQAEKFVVDLNKIVRDVWAELKPVEPAGPRKGEPRPPPVFSSGNGLLTLTVSTWKKPRQIQNPIYSSLSNGQLLRFWAHEAWTEACTRIDKQLSILVQSDIQD